MNTKIVENNNNNTHSAQPSEWGVGRNMKQYILLLLYIHITVASIAQYVAGGWWYTSFICPDGKIESFGDNSNGQLGNGTTISGGQPVSAGVFPYYNAITCGDNHTLLLVNDDTIFSWGINNFGQLGIGGNNLGSLSPVLINSIFDIKEISSGGNHNLALKNDCTIWVWGYNAAGQLGLGSTNQVNIPLLNQSLTGIKGVACGHAHSLVLNQAGNIWAFGYNYYGQLGIGTGGPNTNENIPVQINSIGNIKAISGGGLHSLALKDDGTVYAWGYNYYGQLGNGTMSNSYIPIQVQNLTNVISIAAGGYHSLALKNNGTIWAWGANMYGQLGNSSNVHSLQPVQVSTITDVVAIATGGLHSLAIKNDGTLWVWGYNESGQIGDDTKVNWAFPQKVNNLCYPLSFSDFNIKSIIKCYPNPFFGSTKIDIYTPKYEIAIFQLMDISGKIVREEMISESREIYLNDNALQPGMYFCRILKEGRILANEKLIKLK